jgi:hypothetical protein
MKRLKKISAVSLLIALCATPAFSQTSMATLQDAVEKFSGDLVKSLPFNASIGLNWSDAYIGKVFPSLPPHFGVGVAAGMTTMKVDGFEELTKAFGADLGLGFMPIPAYVAEARIGGFILPFDLGLKFGMLPEDTFDLGSVKLGYTLFGASIRYAVIDNLILPKISVGVGVNYLKGSVGVPVGNALEFTFPNLSGGLDTLALSQPELVLEWETTALDFTVQASKSLFIITPYLGFGASYAKSKAGYGVKTTLKYNGQPMEDDTTFEALKTALSTAGLGSIDVEKDGFGRILEDEGLAFRAFGGLSLNLAIIRLDLTAMLNFADMNFGGTVGARVQL